jgi:hypothetical protein
MWRMAHYTIEFGHAASSHVARGSAAHAAHLTEQRCAP